MQATFHRNLIWFQVYSASISFLSDACSPFLKQASATEADDRFVLVLSDANFERYNMSPRKFGAILTSDENVKSFAIFIGSLGSQVGLALLRCCYYTSINNHPLVALM